MDEKILLRFKPDTKIILLFKPDIKIILRFKPDTNGAKTVLDPDV